MQVFAAISELIDLVKWIKFNPSFIPWLVLIVLSGTESNRRINFHPRLARFNPRLTLISFPGTGARTTTRIKLCQTSSIENGVFEVKLC